MEIVADSADRPAREKDEIEITPEMIEAGIEILYGYDRESAIAEDTVVAIYLAMREVVRV
jgi:hypothetical protein